MVPRNVHSIGRLGSITMKPQFFILCLLAMVLLVPSVVATVGNISVSSTPSGASIYLDNSDSGMTTTATIESVPSGIHTIILTRSGYGNYTFGSVNVSEGQTTTLTAVLTAATLAPTISGISPSSGYNSSIVTVTITGTGFSTPLSSIVLTQSGQTNIAATSISASATSISCQFPITGKPAGLWDVVVTNSDGQSDTFSGFTINNAGSTITLSSITPDSGLVNTTISITNLAGTNFLSTATIKLSRTGYNDIPGTATYSSSTKLTGTIDLDDRIPGTYQVCVANDATNYLCGLSFTVNSPNTINGTFSITSSPSNANVYLDSVLKGITPLKLTGITPDTYIVSIRKTGYVSYTKQFNVTAGNTTYVSASLTADATDSPTLASLTAATAATTATPTKKSTAKTYTPYPTATPTQKSPVPFELCGVAIALGLVLIRKKD